GAGGAGGEGDSTHRAADTEEPPQLEIVEPTPSAVTGINIERGGAAAEPASHLPSPPGRGAGGEGPDEDLPFQKLGHYEIVSRLGQGGMGEVYLGYERSLDRWVAIKVLPAQFARERELVRRFHAEAASAAKLIHPNIIQIYFIGED